MLDVLGLSNQIDSREGLLRTLDTYKSVIQNVREHSLITRSTLSPEYDAHHVEVAEFVFDTLVLVSHPLDALNGAASFLSCVCGLMAHFAMNNLPLRGAVGIGDFLADEGTKLFLSDIFKRLNYAISEQAWSGCCILEEYEAQIPNHVFAQSETSSGRSAGLCRYRVPMKRGQSKELWCLNWLHAMPDASVDSLLEYLHGDEEKYTHTKAFIDYFRGFPSNLMELPAEFSPATFVRMSRLGTVKSVSYWDAAGNPAKYGCRNAVFHPNHAASIGNGFVGYDDDSQRAVRQIERWGKEYP
jgi:hypothetical protein